MLKKRLVENKGLLLAGAGAVVGLTGLLLLPFATVTVDLNASGVVRGQGSLAALRVDLNIAQMAREYVSLWLSVPLTLGILALILGLLLRDDLAHEAGVSRKGWIYTLVGGALLNILLLIAVQWLARREIQMTYLHFPIVEERINNSYQGVLNGILVDMPGGQALLRHLALLAQASMEMAPGFYVALIGMGCVIAGGWLALLDESGNGGLLTLRTGASQKKEARVRSGVSRSERLYKAEARQQEDVPLREYVSHRSYVPIDFS